MKRKRFLNFFSFFFISLLLASSSPCAETKVKESRLNFLLITIDTLRADRVSCYSSEHVKTPNIDRLAEKGILFTRAFAHNPLTLPSHANILLGTTPSFHGVHDNVNFSVKEEFLTLAEHLKNNGYATGAFVGAYPLDSRFGLDQGFDVYDDEFKSKGSPKFHTEEKKAEAVVNSAQKWLKMQKGPWYLWIHLFDPHFPYDPPEPFLTQFEKQPYDGEVAYVDFILGKLFRFMDESGLFENTFVVFTSDHGESLGQHEEQTHGIFAYNTTIWVPLILSIPGVKPIKIHQNVSHTDIFPTTCDVLSIEKPPFLQGISVLPALMGEKLPERKIYFESLDPYYNFGWAPLRGFIHQKEKFIDSPIPEIYDLETDFDESKNLAGHRNLKGYREQLEQTLLSQSHPEGIDARTRLDREALEKLKSLGYVVNPMASKKDTYGPEYDVKTLLPIHNKIIDAYRLKDKGRIEEGIELLNKIIKEQKRIDAAYSYLARLYRESGEMDEALLVLQEGLDQHPSSYDILSLYCQLLMDAGQYDAIIDVLNSKYLSQMEQDPSLWNKLGVAYLKKGDSENAIQVFEKAVSIDNEYTDIFYNLGSIYLSLFLKTKEKNAFEKAIQNLKRVIEIDPGHPAAHNGLGAAYMQVGETDEAIRFWKKTVELNPDSGKTYYYLGLAYCSISNTKESHAYLNLYKSKYGYLITLEEMKILNEIILKCRPKTKD